jgi:subtilase family serine protease
VQSAFRTEIHSYNVKGKTHFANSTAPMIPASLSGIVGGFRGLHDFFPHSMLKQHPAYSVSAGGGGFFTFIAPGDLATLYDINPLYQMNPAIDGTGQKVVIAGQSDVYLADLNNFRNAFGLSTISGCTTNGGVITACDSTNFQMVVPGTGNDPGVSPGDLGESDLDIEWVGSVARSAKIIFVTSSNGVDDSATWAIDQNPPLAPVISYSYGLCEAFVTAPSIATAEVEYQKAAGEGISFFAATGDSGAGECDGDAGNFPAVLGLSVSYPASSPNVTGVGGTEFNEGTGTYWNATNTNGTSVISYIPELAWNDSTLTRSLDATGGGPSNCAFGTGTTNVTVGTTQYLFELCKAPTAGGFPKPSWQSALTPNDSVRDVPDISFSASNVNDPYIVCAPLSEVGGTGTASSCANGITSALQLNPPSAFGGTSASTPVAAGMAVLLNQYLGTNGLGNINPELYTVIYPNNPTVFNDVSIGQNTSTQNNSDNIVPCTATKPTFEPQALRCTGTSFGYTAGTGYDLVTGLGSVDISALAVEWGANTLPGFSLAPANPTYLVAQGSPLDVTINLTSLRGFDPNANPVTYTCTDTANESTCTGPTAATSSTSPSFHITTTAATHAERRAERNGIFYAALLPGLFGIMFTLGLRKRSQRGMRLAGLMMVLGCSTLWLGSCGGGSSTPKDPGTLKTTYTLTVKGTAGNATSTTTFQLTVQ